MATINNRKKFFYFENYYYEQKRNSHFFSHETLIIISDTTQKKCIKKSVEKDLNKKFHAFLCFIIQVSNKDYRVCEPHFTFSFTSHSSHLIHFSQKFNLYFSFYETLLKSPLDEIKHNRVEERQAYFSCKKLKKKTQSSSLTFERAYMMLF
jgi:hypothetical protein